MVWECLSKRPPCGPESWSTVVDTPVANGQKQGRIAKMRGTMRGYPRDLWALIIAILVFWIGRGMISPFLVIFFTQIIDLPGPLVGAGIAVASLIGIFGGLAVAGTIDRHGGQPVLMGTILTMGIGTILLGWASSAVLFLVFITIYYTASQTYWPAVDSVTVTLADKERVIPSMSMVRVANSMGIGIGGFIGGIVVAGGGLTAYRVMFTLAGLIVLIAPLLIFLKVPRRRINESQDGEPELAGSWGQVLADKTFVYALLVLFLLVLGFTQVQMSVPPFLRAEADVGEGMIGGLFFLNTLLVILLQVPIAARVDRGNPGLLLPLTAALWAGAFLLMTGTVGQSWLAVMVFLFFTAGELIFMPITAIFSVRLSPVHLRGRYFASTSVTWGASFAIATFAAGWMQDASNPMLMWPAMILLMAICGFASLRLRRSRRLQPDSMPDDPPAGPALQEAIAD